VSDVDQGGSDSVFSLAVDSTRDGVTVVVDGEVDMSTADAMYAAATAENAGGRLTLDLRGVTFFDSAAIHALLRIADKHPGRLTVVPSHQVRRVLELAGLGDQPWVDRSA
jgi:stage II sporulation protein AA (anti-sigma F factor antagonist)